MRIYILKQICAVIKRTSDLCSTGLKFIIFVIPLKKPYRERQNEIDNGTGYRC